MSELGLTPACRLRLSGPALRTFFRVANAWGLTANQQRTLLGAPPFYTFSHWQANDSAAVDVGQEVLERISCIVGIYKALLTLFPNSHHAGVWIQRPNTASPYGGQSALSLMVGGRIEDLRMVREHLDAQRGWN